MIHLLYHSLSGNFIGYLFFEDRNMSVELVKEGLSSMHFTAERGKYFSQLSRYINPRLFLRFKSSTCFKMNHSK